MPQYQYSRCKTLLGKSRALEAPKESPDFLSVSRRVLNPYRLFVTNLNGRQRNR